MTAAETPGQTTNRIFEQDRVESSWEDSDLGVREGRPRRRYYQLTRDGAEYARFALAEISRVRDKRRATLSAARPGTL